jgi:hypothetical protein
VFNRVRRHWPQNSSLENAITLISKENGRLSLLNRSILFLMIGFLVGIIFLAGVASLTKPGNVLACRAPVRVGGFQDQRRFQKQGATTDNQQTMVENPAHWDNV